LETRALLLTKLLLLLPVVKLRIEKCRLRMNLQKLSKISSADSELAFLEKTIDQRKENKLLGTGIPKTPENGLRRMGVHQAKRRVGRYGNAYQTSDYLTTGKHDLLEVHPVALLSAVECFDQWMLQFWSISHIEDYT
jgi:hypothetical protein